MKQMKKTKKQKLLDEIRQGLKEVKAIREGEAKSYTMADLFIPNAQNTNFL